MSDVGQCKICHAKIRLSDVQDHLEAEHREHALAADRYSIFLLPETGVASRNVVKVDAAESPHKRPAAHHQRGSAISTSSAEDDNKGALRSKYNLRSSQVPLDAPANPETLDKNAAASADQPSQSVDHGSADQQEPESKSHLTGPNDPTAGYNPLRARYLFTRVKKLMKAGGNPLDKVKTMLMLGADVDGGQLFEHMLSVENLSVVGTAATDEGSELLRRIVERNTNGSVVPASVYETDCATLFLQNDAETTFRENQDPVRYDAIVCLPRSLEIDDPFPLAHNPTVLTLLDSITQCLNPGGCVVGSYCGESTMPGYVWITVRDSQDGPTTAMGVYDVAPHDTHEYLGKILSTKSPTVSFNVVLVEPQTEFTHGPNLAEKLGEAHVQATGDSIDAVIAAFPSGSYHRPKVESFAACAGWFTMELAESARFVHHIVEPELDEYMELGIPREKFGYEIAPAHVDFCLVRKAKV